MRDNWCVGFTDRFTVAVWVGNFEGDAMGAGVSGVVGAAPAWRDIVLHLHRDSPGRALNRPGPVAGVVAAPVRFVPAIEPPRTELFLPGTALGTVALSAAIVARATASTGALAPQPLPQTIMLGLRMIPSSATRAA